MKVGLSPRLASLVVMLFALCGVLVSASASAKTQSSSADTQRGGKLVVVASGGTYYRGLRIAYLVPFQRETGIKIQIVSGGDSPVAQIQAQVASGNVLWDVVVCGPDTELAFPDLWQPIDRKVVKERKDMALPGLIGKSRMISDLEVSPALVYSTRAYPGSNRPKSWADFYDVQKFPGPRGVSNLGLSSAWRMPATALLADGVPPNQLFPLDLDRAYTVLNRFKPNIRAFYSGFTQGQDLLRSGEVSMAVLTDGRGNQLIDAGAAVRVVYNQGFLFRASLCTPKGSPNAANAMRLYQYILSHPQQQAVFSAITLYGPPTKAGAARLSAAGVSDFSTKHIRQLVPDSPALYNYVRNNSDELLRRWNNYVAG